MGAKRLTIRISGLRYAGSEGYTLERALRREPGVVDVYVNPVAEMAYISPTTRRCLVRPVQCAGPVPCWFRGPTNAARPQVSGEAARVCSTSYDFR